MNLTRWSCWFFLSADETPLFTTCYFLSNWWVWNLNLHSGSQVYTTPISISPELLSYNTYFYPQCHKCQANTFTQVNFTTSPIAIANLEIAITLKSAPNHNQNPPSVLWTQYFINYVLCWKNLLIIAKKFIIIIPLLIFHHTVPKYKSALLKNISKMYAN